MEPINISTESDSRREESKRRFLISYEKIKNKKLLIHSIIKYARIRKLPVNPHRRKHEKKILSFSSQMNKFIKR